VASVLTASVAAMHFTAMAALEIVPDLMPVETGATTRRVWGRTRPPWTANPAAARAQPTTTAASASGGAILPRLVLAAGITTVMLSILGFGVLALFADRTPR
jgi:hypothetical protein